MILRYLIREIPALIAFVLAIAFADIIALFIRKDGRLPFLLRWAATADNPAIGDEAFNHNQMPHVDATAWLGRYKLCRVWIRRNPAYWVDDYFGVLIKQPFQLTIEGNENANISRDATGWVDCVEGKYKKILVNGDGKRYFEYCWVWLGKGRCNRIQLGWHLHTPEVGGRRNLKLTINRW